MMMMMMTKMWDVGCDRMVFAINSDLFLMKFNSKFNEWSLDQGQKTINPLIPFFRKDYSDSGIVMVDGTFLNDSFEQDRSWDDFGTTVSGI